MNKNAGFTLIEVLIAMLVLAVGLLGLAGLQATGLKNNQSAYNRSQAIQLAYDLADRIRANSNGASGLPSIASYTATLPSAAVAQPNCLTVGITCTQALMAQNDLFEWNNAVTTVLPGGVGTIASVTALPTVTITITITWDDNRDGNIDGNDPNFQTSFQCQNPPATTELYC
ncbi:MAG: type IV pilus modification protein PilV [Methylobacter sp.]|nr:type IV pilus modification protein PilV [Methylobacter sp.]